MGDCCIFGAGRLLSFGSISFRMIILFLLLLVSLPLMILNIKELLKNRFLWLVVGFVAWLIISTIVGILNGEVHDVLQCFFCFGHLGFTLLLSLVSRAL